jgi:Sec-independent protein translocase protein TatA
VFGIGPQELILVALLALLIFGPGKAASVARDVGRFAQEARRSVEEFRSELAPGGEDRNDRADGSRSGDLEDGTRGRTIKDSKSPVEGETTAEYVRAPTE